MTIIKLRKKIDAVDARLIKLLAKRFAIAKAIGDLKKKHGRAITDTAREKELVAFHASLEKTYSLSKAFTKSLWRLILKESKRIQRIPKP
ncbi:chorismate mutase [Candidatus Uhrbacteria bacterium]|nr:chorismate mutase [Candidatus Uhrbacteria bacterium]